MKKTRWGKGGVKKEGKGMSQKPAHGPVCFKASSGQAQATPIWQW